MHSVKEIKEQLDNTRVEELPQVLKSFKDDSRNSVIRLLENHYKKLEKLEIEKSRIDAMKVYERRYEKYEAICGIDEVGRGPLAGPVVAAAVILPKEATILYINDSKKISEKKREELYEIIVKKALAVGIGVVSPAVIDDINILQATYEAMRIAVRKLLITPDILLNDAVTIPDLDPLLLQVPIIKGDEKSISIAAASIIAKVTRDRIMKEYHTLYPAYGFESNKGYGSAFHIERLKEIGTCPIHRKSFIKNFI